MSFSLQRVMAVPSITSRLSTITCTHRSHPDCTLFRIGFSATGARKLAGMLRALHQAEAIHEGVFTTRLWALLPLCSCEVVHPHLKASLQGGKLSKKEQNSCRFLPQAVGVTVRSQNSFYISFSGFPSQAHRGLEIPIFLY